MDPADPFKNPCEVDNPQCDNKKNDSSFYDEYITKIVPFNVGAVIWDQVVGSPPSCYVGSVW